MEVQAETSNSEVRRREKRRRRILNRGESRLDRLKNAHKIGSVESSTANAESLFKIATTRGEEDVPHLSSNSGCLAMLGSGKVDILKSTNSSNPPSMAPRRTDSQDSQENKVEDSTSYSSDLSSVAQIMALYGGVWPRRVRFCLVFLCAVVSAVLDDFTDLQYSCVVLNVVLGVGWLLCLCLVQPNYGTSRTAATPLTWLSLLRLPFMFLPSILSQRIDYLLLVCWLIFQFIFDILFMFFITILLRISFLFI